jgi:SRSO17 transposase
MMVAGWSGALAWREEERSALTARVVAVLPRAELRATAGAFVDGLLSGITRKTGWLMAGQAGLERRYRMQSLLRRSRWRADALRDEGSCHVNWAR